MFAAVLLDLDGTLVDSERQNMESVARALARVGRPLSDEERAFIVGHGWREIYALIEKNRPTGMTFEELKSAATAEKIELVRKNGLCVLPGVRKAIQHLGAKRALGVVTGSGRQEAEFTLREIGVWDALRTLVAAEDVPRGKPAPDGFLLGAERLGMAAPRCLAIEDSQAGIAAARAAGMRCLAVAAGNFSGCDQSHADAIIGTLEELSDDLLGRLYQGGPGA